MKKTVRIIFALALVAAMTILGVIAVGAEADVTSDASETTSTETTAPKMTDEERFEQWKNGPCSKGPENKHDLVEENTATCRSGGVLQWRCKYCNVTYRVGYTSKQPHDYTVPTDRKEPTCRDDGYQKYKCKTCSATVTMPLKANGSSHEWATDANGSIIWTPVPGDEPMCGRDGRVFKKCSLCGATEQAAASEVGYPKPEHKWEDLDCVTLKCSVCWQKKAKESATHTEPLYLQYGNEHAGICKKCGVTIVERGPHEYTDDHDCTTEVKCDVCGYVVKKAQPAHSYSTKYIPAVDDPSKGHVRQCVNEGCLAVNDNVTAHDKNGADGACSKCGYKDTGVHEHAYVQKSDAAGHWKECSICGARTEEAGHDAPMQYNGDCGVAVKCSVCGYEVLPALAGHSYSGAALESDSESHWQTCTQPGCTYREKYGHTFVDDDHDCTTPKKCIACGYTAVEGGTDHSWVLVEGSGTEEGHLRSCSNPGCDVDNVPAEHVMGLPATCVSGAECEFCHTHYGAVNPNNHVGGTERKGEKAATENEEGYTGDICCLGCGEVIVKGEVIPKTPPHEHIYSQIRHDGESHWHACEICGAVNEASKTAHIFGAFADNGDGTHSRTCTVCGVVDRESHEHEPENYDCTKPLLCVDCKAVVVAAHASHSFTGRAEGTKDGHTLACVNRNCKVTSTLAPHTGGSASCTSGAHCEVCGFEYTAKDATRHDGGTELRGHKNATETEKGYTGDTYCLGCGEIITKGTDIDMLPSAHEHAFGEWMADGTHHWRECACGDWNGYAAHTYEDGACTVCGALDPDYVHVDVLVDEESGTTATPEENAEYYAGIELNVDVVDETMTKEHADVEATVGKKFEEYKALDITLVDKATGKTAQANGKLTVKVAVPAGWRADATAVYYVHDGVMEKMASTVTEGGAYVTFVTDHFSIYVLVNTSTEVEPEKTPDDTTSTPAETTAAPAETTAAPAETTAKPAETTGAPGSTEPPPTGETFNVTAVCVMLIAASLCGVCATVGAKRGRKN